MHGLSAEVRGPNQLTIALLKGSIGKLHRVFPHDWRRHEDKKPESYLAGQYPCEEAAVAEIQHPGLVVPVRIESNVGQHDPCQQDQALPG